MPIAEELHKLLGDDFHFIATFPRNPNELKGGIDWSSLPYCLLPAENSEHLKTAKMLNLMSDVCVYGAGNLEWERERASTGKLSFEISERWFKRGYLNLLSPRLWSWWWLYQTRLRHKPFYKLCASAYTAQDCRILMTYKDKCYKWGYFTQVSQNIVEKPKNQITRIMWCGRLIALKHPEHAIKVTERLKNEGYKFYMEMYGDGELKNDVKLMIDKASLNDSVKLMGNKPNSEILTAMSNSDIFLFTSDRNEGWGAVANEAMSSGCCVIGNGHIGSVPYLINNKANGLIYDGNDPEESLYLNLKYALENPKEVRAMGLRANKDIIDIWSPQTASSNLLKLIDELLATGKTSLLEGPCSKAY